MEPRIISATKVQITNGKRQRKFNRHTLNWHFTRSFRNKHGRVGVKRGL